jgi:hypothetical protein
MNRPAVLKFRGAKGAKCKSLGQRPRCEASLTTSAVGAKLHKTTTLYIPLLQNSTLIRRATLGRYPRLLHFARLAPASRLAIQSVINTANSQVGFYG